MYWFSVKDLILGCAVLEQGWGKSTWPSTSRTERLCAEECRFHNTPFLSGVTAGQWRSIWWPFVKQSHPPTAWGGEASLICAPHLCKCTPPPLFLFITRLWMAGQCRGLSGLTTVSSTKKYRQGFSSIMSILSLKSNCIKLHLGLKAIRFPRINYK